MFYSKRNVLVTGGASFIGSHLVDQLLLKGASVTVVDDLSSGTLQNLEQSMDAIQFIDGDLRDYSVGKSATEGQDIVFHLANIHGGRGFIDTHPGEIVQNFAIDGNVFRAAQENGVERVCYTSSACAYPVNLQTMDTADNMNYLSEEMADPFTPGAALADGEYGWAKLMGEMALKGYHKQFGLKGVSCRLFTVYGPRENESHAVIALIAKAIIEQDPYEIWGTGKQSRNFTYVSDIVEGILLSAEKITDCRAVNVGTDDAITLADAARTILDVTGHAPEEIFYDTSKPEGVSVRTASIENQKQWLGWSPRVSFAEGIAKTIEWYLGSVDRKTLVEHFETLLFERSASESRDSSYRYTQAAG